MARLNEAPAPAPESIDSLKRRFIRQNRELIRANSTQSIRIRNLESEISRLLAENINIREQAIATKIENEKYRAAQRLNKEILRMKEQLESKLVEVSALVYELGGLPDKLARRSSQQRRRSGLVQDLLKHHEEREKRSRPTILEAEGRLPAIDEHKQYPRRTLDQAELVRVQQENQDNESPEIGPPPVAHFEEAEAVVYDPVKSPRRTSTELVAESDRDESARRLEVEKRRKRRVSTLLRSIDLEDDALNEGQSAPTTAEQIHSLEPSQTSMLSRGAKRKLEKSDLEEKRSGNRQVDDFVYHPRIVAVPAVSKGTRFTRPIPQSTEDVSVVPSPEKTTLPARRILAPKSTNSPAKRRELGQMDKSARSEPVVQSLKLERRAASTIRTKSITIEAASNNMDSTVQTTDEHERLAQRPETPAAELGDLLSPTLTEPSTKQRLSQEIVASASVEDVLNGSIGRGSRRARSAVSYAEPSLRDKMRRPGKELVGAVEGIAKPSAAQEITDANIQRSMSTDPSLASAKQEPISQDSFLHRQPDLKQVKEGKNDPISPLRNRQPSAPRSSGADTVREAEQLGTALAKLSVFEHPDSSPTIDKEQSSSISSVSRTSGIVKAQRTSIQLKSGSEASEHKRSSSALEIRDVDKSRESADSKTSKSGFSRSVSTTALSGARQQGGRVVKPAALIPVNDPGMAYASENQVVSSRSSAMTRRRSMAV